MQSVTLETGFPPFMTGISCNLSPPSPAPLPPAPLLPHRDSFNIETSKVAHVPGKEYPTEVKIKGPLLHPNLHVPRQQHSPLTGTNNSPHKSRRMEEENDEICHKAAVVRCGWMLIKTFKFLEFLPPQQVEVHKCAFRNVSATQGYSAACDSPHSSSRIICFLLFLSVSGFLRLPHQDRRCQLHLERKNSSARAISLAPGSHSLEHQAMHLRPMKKSRFFSLSGATIILSDLLSETCILFYTINNH